jgi:hypothetical protein
MGLRYSGPAVEAGSMDVYEASANMIAFSEFVVLAAKAQFGDAAEIKAEVSGFERGSFETEIVFHVAGAAATIFSGLTVQQVWDTVKDAIDIWRFLRGRPPSKIEPTKNNPQSVVVTNNDGNILQVSTQSLTVVFSDKGSEAVGQFVRHALEKPGIDQVAISDDRGSVTKVFQDEAQYFVPVAPSQTVTDVTIPMALIIEAPVFKEDNKWRFSDGQQSFFATIEDKEFLARVNAGERFGKGDILLADVRINQQQSGMKLTAERTIVHVKEHRTGPTQLSL